MNRVRYFLISIFLLHHFLFASTEELFQSFSKGESISVKAVVDNYYDAKKSYDNDSSMLANYIDACTLLSYEYATGELSSYENLVENLEKELNSVIKKYRNDPDILLKYSDFLYSEFSWNKNNFHIIQRLPIIYRRICSISPGNKVAQLKLALWYANASNKKTGNWNSFIKAQEKNVSLLSGFDLYNAYILYSMFYLKSYDTQSGLAYLQKAKELYPNNALASLVEYNYSKGIIGW